MIILERNFDAYVVLPVAPFPMQGLSFFDNIGLVQTRNQTSPLARIPHLSLRTPILQLDMTLSPLKHTD